MINGSLVNSTTFSEELPELTWPERGIIFIYLLAVFLISTIGNLFVLIMSRDLKSVTKDSKGSFILINVALVDFLYNFVVTFPMMVSVLSRRWILGAAYCFLDAFFETYLGIVEMLFIFLISLQRTIVIKFPFKQMHLISTKRVYIAIAIIYVATLAPAIFRTIATTQIFGYLPEELHCDTTAVATTQPWVTMLRVCLVIFTGIPIPCTVLFYGYMMFFAMSKSEVPRTTNGKHRIKNGGGTQMKGPNKALQTVSLIVGIYLISISLTIILIGVRIRKPDIPWRLQTASICLWLLNTAVNPIIYVFNNNIFRAHVKRLILRKRGIYAQNSSIQLSIMRRITQQSMMNLRRSTTGSHPGFGPGLERSLTSQSIVASIPNTEAPRQNIQMKMNVLTEEPDVVETGVAQSGVLVIENKTAVDEQNVRPTQAALVRPGDITAPTESTATESADIEIRLRH